MIRGKLLRAMLAAFCFAALLLPACGKQTDQPKSTVLSAAGSERESQQDSDSEQQEESESEASSAEWDIVNGFRFEHCDEMVYCVGEGVRLRKKPGLDGEQVGTLRYGAYVQRIGKNAKWSRILVNGERLYVASNYLSPYPPETEAETGEEVEPDAETEGEAD